MTALSVRGLTMAYGRGEPVLSGLDLEVAGGELTAVLGAPGCGKTTLLRIIAGFLTPTGGTVTANGRTLSGPGVRVPPEKRGIGIVAQEGALFPHLSVERNIAFGLSRVKRVDRRARIEESLALVGLDGFGGRMPYELSGGQRQRVALARVLVPHPALVLLDEPFDAVDSTLRVGLRNDVRRALAAMGSTAILVTHDPEEAVSVADRVAVLSEGRVLRHDIPRRPSRRPVGR
ncbi:ABC transporter ATP-binding protein [Streptomyces profundus]|uniref:ABC transporter ATP-binding protein n=1 Tax=Streptomyces profundus TaxID=2867410 RepID=UPI002ADE42F2|nr:ABC transporter ATP-binding protein [Streptomyces sp. MA3_2.13]UED86438.1 ABC transporter ATP-binding protein [Streptomyces sp. MA3_2.13]